MFNLRWYEIFIAMFTGRGKLWIKRMSEDRKHNLSRLLTDIEFFKFKLNEWEPEEKIRKKLEKEQGKVKKDKKGVVIEDKSDGKLIKKLNMRIDSVITIKNQLTEAEAKVVEFDKYIAVVSEMYRSRGICKKFNELWRR